MIDHATIERIMQAADIVDVVKEFVTLRKAGVNYKGLCPFHDEKTPSFVVSPSKQLCKCFSCGKGGNVVHFIMQHEQMTYPEALKWLARKYGIEVKEKELTDEEKQASTLRESMFVVNEWAEKYFEEMLHSNVDGVALGMGYFRQRGFRDDIIRKFHLGFSLPERDAMAKAALARGFKAELLEKTGLCYRTDDGRLLDRYHGRVIFPVHTVSGMVVAFGGRILTSDKKVAKYVNSPESEIYSKSHELYGLFLAKHAIVKEGCCFLVEGYTDVISMHQSGIENVVASSGTSLTEGQIRLLHRFTENITVLYDGDSAGIKASLRGIDMLLSEGLNIKVLLLPDGDDPDSFARKHSATEYRAYIAAHQVDFIRFKTNLLLADAGDDPLKRAALIQDVVKSVSVIPNEIVRQTYISECARSLNVGEALVTAEVAKAIRTRRNGGNATTSQAETTNKEKEATVAVAEQLQTATGIKEEEQLIAAVIRYGALKILGGTPSDEEAASSDGRALSVSVARFVADDLKADGLTLRSPLHQRILEEACNYVQTNEEADTLHYFLMHPDATVSQLAERLGTDKYELSLHQQAVFVRDENRLEELIPRLLHDFKNSYVKAELKSILRKLSSPEVRADEAQCQALMQQYMDLSEVERQFAKVLGDRVLNTP